MHDLVHGLVVALHGHVQQKHVMDCALPAVDIAMPTTIKPTCICIYTATIDTEATDILLQYSLVCDTSPGSDGLAEVASSPRIAAATATSHPSDAEAMIR